MQGSLMKGNCHMKCSELKEILKKNGCYKINDGSKHEIWFSPITNNKISVGRHNNEDVRTGTCHAILRQAGIK